MAPKIKRYAGTTEVRAWARDLSDEDRKRLNIEDVDVQNRGRLHSKVIRAFNQTMRSKGVKYVPIARNQPLIDEVFEAADKGEDSGLEIYRQPRQEQPVEKESEPVPALSLPPTPGPVLDMLKNTNQPVVVVYVPMAV